MEFTEDEWIGLKDIVMMLALNLFHPFSNKAVELLEKLNVKRYKVGSGVK